MPRRAARPRAARLAVAAGLALALCGGLSGCTSPEERFADHLAAAEELVAEGARRDAILELRSALKLQPESAEANDRLAALLVEEGAVSEAVFHYHEAYRLDPSRVDAAMAEAGLLYFTDRKRAQELIDEALERFPDRAIVHRSRSSLALVKADTETALAAAEKAVELDPEDFDSWIQLGRVHQGRIKEQQLAGATASDAIFEAAIAAFRRADEVAGGHPGARVEQARVFSAWKGHASDAADAYRSAVELAAEQGEPTHHLVAAWSAEEYARESGKPRLRRWALRHIVTVSPERLDAWDALAAVTEEIEGPGKGDDVYRELIDARPKDVRAHLRYAAFLSERGRDADAITHLAEAIVSGAESPVLREELIRSLLQSGLLADARATYTVMADRFPDAALTRRAEARLALAEGRARHAAETLRSIDGAVGETPATLQLLAYAEYRSANPTAALQALERAIAVSDGDAVAANRLKARIHFEQEDYTAALRVLSELIGSGHRFDPHERLMRAQALYRIGRPAPAQQVLERLLEDEDAPPDAALEFLTRHGDEYPVRAARYLESALARAPGNFEVLEALTSLDLAAGRSNVAFQRVNRAVESGEAGPRALLMRAQLLARARDLESAEADALRAFEAAPDLPEAVDTLMAIYQAQGRLDEARRSFREAEEVGVLHPGARLLLARLHLHFGDQREGRKILEELLEENPEMPGAKNDLAFLLADQSSGGPDLDRALELARSAQRELRRVPSTTDTVGYVYLRKGLPERALAEFDKAIQLAEQKGTHGTAPFHYHRGLALRALDRPEQAAEAFEKALELDAHFRNADDARRELEAARRMLRPSSSPS